MTNVLRNGDLFFLYSPTSDVWFGKSIVVMDSNVPFSNNILTRSPDSVSLMAVPTQVQDSRDAALLMIESTNTTDNQILPGTSFRIRTLQDNTDNRIYVALDRNTSVEGVGQPIRYDMASFRDETIWRIPRAPSLSVLYHGVPYSIHNESNDTVLRPFPYPSHPRLVSQYEVPPESTWIFIPSQSLWTCEKETEQCLQTSGWENLLLMPHCDTKTSNKCFDKFGQRVYYSAQECMQKCGRLDQDSSSSSSISSSSSSTQGTPGSSESSESPESPGTSPLESKSKTGTPGKDRILQSIFSKEPAGPVKSATALIIALICISVGCLFAVLMGMWITKSKPTFPRNKLPQV